jgi:hypothetical protein
MRRASFDLLTWIVAEGHGYFIPAPVQGLVHVRLRRDAPRSALRDIQRARRHLPLRRRRHALPRLQSVQPRPPLQILVREEHGLALIGGGSGVPSQSLEQIAEVSAEPPEYSLLLPLIWDLDQREADFSHDRQSDWDEYLRQEQERDCERTRDMKRDCRRGRCSPQCGSGRLVVRVKRPRERNAPLNPCPPWVLESTAYSA